MNRVIEILENNGLVSEELAERFIFNTPRKLVLKIRESILERVAECEIQAWEFADMRWSLQLRR